MHLTRKEFLKFLGAGSVAVAIGPAMASRAAHAALVHDRITPVRLPNPLFVYSQGDSFLPTGLDGEGVSGNFSENLSEYKVIDDVVVSPEFDRYILVAWGDRIFPEGDDYFGYNNDYTAFVPTHGKDLAWFVVSHEYVSYPFHLLAPAAPAAPEGYPTGPGGRSFESAVGDEIGLTLPDSIDDPSDKTLLWGEFLYNLGMSILRIRRRRDGRYEVDGDFSDNWRITGAAGLGLNKRRPGGFPSSWGTQPHQQGGRDYLEGTGPAAREVFPLSEDGLGKKIIGTFANCSGGTTPWGTVLSCEENFQGSSLFFVGVTEAVNPDGTQVGYTPDTVGEWFGLVGEKYGWVVEVDPAHPRRRAKKHTWLGRFRHENVSVRAEAGSPLVCYMGDDRRGGHWYKFVSKGSVRDPGDPRNSRLFRHGTLYVARFDRGGTGEWLPLALDTPTNPNLPSEIASVQIAEQGVAEGEGAVPLPKRVGIAGQNESGGRFDLTIDNEADAAPDYQNKTLRDFYPTQGAILCDAFLASNLIGGTPTSRPEDCELHPLTKDLYLAQTDGAPGSDGYPDSRIFVVAKYISAIDAAQQSGDLIRITEDSPDGAGQAFTWTRFTKGGEYGTRADSEAAPLPGDGYANVDNLAFDPKGNLWGLTDMSTGLHNGFEGSLVLPGQDLEETVVNHEAVGSSEAEPLIGVFGNNWLFYVPTEGDLAGIVIPVAQGPNRNEMTGPTIVDDTLFIAVQHPGEDTPIRETAAETQTRSIQILKGDGSGIFEQKRTITKGSQWPSNILGIESSQAIPKPAVIGLRRIS